MLPATIKQYKGKAVKIRVAFSEEVHGAMAPREYTGVITELTYEGYQAYVVLDNKIIINCRYILVMEIL